MTRHEKPTGGAGGSFDDVHFADERPEDTAPAHQLQLRYPHSPGWRSGPNSATSKAAALIASERAQPLKQRVLTMLADGPASPEELERRFADAGERVLLNTIRARCSDLHARGEICPSGTFSVGESGRARVIRWRMASPEERAIFTARQAAEAEHRGDR